MSASEQNSEDNSVFRKKTKNTTTQKTKNVSNSDPGFASVSAAVLMLLGFLGCCGTWKASRCLLYLFAVLSIVLLIAEVALCIYCLVDRNRAIDQAQRGMQKSAVSISHHPGS